MDKRYTATAKIKDVSIQDGLFGRVSRLVKEQVLPYQWDILNDVAKDAVPDHSIENFSVAEGNDEGYPSHCIANFRIAAGEEQGDFLRNGFPGQRSRKMAGSSILPFDEQPG